MTKDHWLAAPGVVFPGLVREVIKTSRLEHLMFTAPFPWAELGAVELGEDITTHWLIGVAISDSERDFLISQGLDRFEALMETRDVEYWRLDRPPMV